MERYIDKSALVAEIEDWRDKIRKGIFDIPLTGSDRAYATFEYEILGKIKDFIDTLEMKGVQEELVNNDLEEAAKKYAKEYLFTAAPTRSLTDHFKAGAMWQKAHNWKLAEGPDLPVFDKEVIVLVGIKNPVTTDSLWGCEVAFAHRPNPDGWDGKSITTGEVEHYEAQTYDKGGWNIPDVKFWLDCNMDSIFKRNNENNKINKR